MSTFVQSDNKPQGFYVWQAAIGYPLEFQPPLGTVELDVMMDLYIPGQASTQEKRTAISMDFFNNMSLTGESVKFYSVPQHSYASASNSPASSMQDSGYGSNFTSSPVAQSWSFSQVSRASSSSSSSSTLRTRQSRIYTSSSIASPSVARQQANDFSYLPGMKILTADGRDVTNAASRGCKTKEQREHAHLMRIIKACDSCRRKKIRCDPSHKKDAVSKSSRSQALPKPIRQTRRQPRSSPSPSRQQLEPDPWSQIQPLPLDDSTMPNLDMYGPLPQLGLFDDLLDLPPNFDLSSPQPDWDSLTNHEGLLSPMSGTSSSPDPSVYTPYSWLSPSPRNVQTPHSTLLDEQRSPSPKLPYMDNNGPAHNYVDFNLYSPASSFTDEEPLFTDDSLYDCVNPVLDPRQPSDKALGICSRLNSTQNLPLLQQSPSAASALSRDRKTLTEEIDVVLGSRLPQRCHRSSDQQQLSQSSTLHKILLSSSSGSDSAEELLDFDILSPTPSSDSHSQDVQTLLSATLFDSPSNTNFHATDSDYSSYIDLSSVAPIHSELLPQATPQSELVLISTVSRTATQERAKSSLSLLQPARISRDVLSQRSPFDPSSIASLQFLVLISTAMWFQDKVQFQPSKNNVNTKLIILSLVAYLAAAILLHGIAALDYGSSMHRLEGSVPGMVVCAVAYVISRNSMLSRTDGKVGVSHGRGERGVGIQWPEKYGVLSRGMERLRRGYETVRCWLERSWVPTYKAVRVGRMGKM